jgi:tyrosine-protein kinase Etk/Wzc
MGTTMIRQEYGLQDSLATEIVDVQVAGSEVSMMEIVAFLLRRKKLIGCVAGSITLIGAALIFLATPSYRAEATILPPQQAQSSLASLASGAMGGMAASGMASQLGLKNPSDLYIGILKSRTISDAIVKRFHLQQVYKEKRESDTLAALSKHASFASGKDTLISISVTDLDPHRAAEIANAYVDELHNENSRLALTDASQRRLFFERELVAEKNALADAEVALKSTQQSTGMLAPAGQAEVLIKSAAQLRAEIASRQVELKALQSYATDENPKVQILRREISAMEGQLGQLEASGFGSKFEVSGNRMPEASLEYIRKLRDVKYHETLFELMAKQYEAARLDEAKQAPVIQIVDRAVAPDRPARTSRSVLLAGFMLLGLLLGSAIAFGIDYLRKFQDELKKVNSLRVSESLA